MYDWRNSPQVHLLRCHLSAFVPLVIQEYLLGQRLLVLPRHDLAQVIAAHGDALLYRVPGQTARVVSALVEAVAILAFCPGGVTLAALDLHFEVPPRQAMALLEEQGLLQSTASPVRPSSPPKPGPVDTGQTVPSPTFEEIYRRRVSLRAPQEV